MIDPEKKKPSPADALRMKAAARLKRAQADEFRPSDPVGARWYRREADEAEQQAEDALRLPEKPAIGAGRELVLPDDEARGRPAIADTVEAPDCTTAQASLERLSLVNSARCLSLGVDAAESIQARNSLEKMLAHQLAAAHKLAMTLAGQALIHAENSEYAHLGADVRYGHSVEAARLAKSSARLMTSFNDGLMALDRLRRGPNPPTLAQRVHVSDGGQAVVAGSLNAGLQNGRSKK